MYAYLGLSNIMTDGDFLRTSCGSPNYAAPVELFLCIFLLLHNLGGYIGKVSDLVISIYFYLPLYKNI